MQCYLVGGAVRDRLLGYPYSERDWVVVGATPEEMTRAGFQPIGRDFPVFLHPQTHEEYALARTERKSGRGYYGFTVYAAQDVTLEQDLIRRDLTINAMAETEDGQLVDPYGGLRDLEARWLRHVSPAFVEDPLRVLRVARFAARYAHLGFKVAPETMTLMQSISASGELESLAAERVWKETERALAERSPQVFMSVLNHCGATDFWFPELKSPGEPTLLALERAGVSNSETPVRFALMCGELEPAALTALCSRLKAPIQHGQLAELLIALTPLTVSPPQAESLLTVLERIDAWRRPERCPRITQALDLQKPGTPWSKAIREGLAITAAINAKQLVAQGLKGPAVGAALREQRFKRLQEMMNDH